jgi:hypothetical protein
MTTVEALHDVVSPRARGQWLTYAIPLLVYGFLGALGLHEGLREVGHFLVLVAICVLQLWRPTLLGWAALFVPLAAYVLLLLGKLGELPLNEVVIFLGLGAAACVALWLGRPRGNWRSTLLAVVIASVAAFVIVKSFY